MLREASPKVCSCVVTEGQAVFVIRADFPVWVGLVFQVKHLLRMYLIGKQEQPLEHLMRINGWTEQVR